MKKAMMAMTMMFALGCFAQSSGSSSAGSMDSSGQSSSSGAMDNGSSSSMNKGMKGDKTLKGCIQSQNGGYVLEEKGGKMAMLSSSQDLSAHVGHMVKVHGMWQKNSGASASSMGSTASSAGSADNNGGNMSEGSNKSKMGNMSQSGQTFMVDKLDMISDQCKMDKGMSH